MAKNYFGVVLTTKEHDKYRLVVCRIRLHHGGCYQGIYRSKWANQPAFRTAFSCVLSRRFTHEKDPD